MAAVIRVKRRLEEEPFNALVLNCKRRKQNEPENDVSAVLKFAGTLESQDADLLSHINKLPKAQLEANYKKHVPDISTKLKQQVKDASENNRYKVVNCFRAIDPAALAKNVDDPKVPDTSGFTVVDIEIDNVPEDEDFSHSDTAKLLSAPTPQYVYDLYYTNSDDFGYEGIYNDMFSVHPYNDELVFGAARENGECSSNEEDSDDSNDENNWRNDYPDSDGSVDEDDMARAMERVTFDEVSDLSSDAGEEKLVYGVDSEGAGFEEEVDEADVRRHGELYAKFKARAKTLGKENVASDLYYGDLSDDSDQSNDNCDYY